MEYNFREIEAHWQQYWTENQTFKATNNSNKPKFYVLDMFPYPSGAGLHVGHPLGYIASDIYARYKRHKGFNVLHPQGYDSFGLPAEQYAIQTGQHPAVTTEANIATYRKQLDQIGFSFDWSREVRTSDPNYYKWTQWIFIQLFNSWYNKTSDKAEDISTLIAMFEVEGNAAVKAVCDDDITIFSSEEWKSYSEEKQQDILLKYRLTFLSETEVNWCPALGTVLANDEIVNGVSERGGHTVVRKKMKQWSMRITAYAQRLLDGLTTIDWPQPLKDIQTYWIGRSEGAMVTFDVLSPTLSKGKGANAGYLTGGNNSHLLLERAKEMRANPTQAEAVLWEQIKSKKLDNKFRQQHLIEDFIVDFVCLSKKLIVEVDGGIHDSQVEQDAERTKVLEGKGYKVIRFKNEEVIGNIDAVVSKIIEELSKAPLSFGEGSGERIEVFTTRPDTIFGVSFMTLAPEHELVSKITTAEQKSAVESYIKATSKRSELERMADVKTISGVFTGAYAAHPFTGEKVQIWIGDYVLAGYGTGAVMAVPCGDERDYAFAKHFGIDIINIFEGVDISEEAFTDKEGSVIGNSDFLSGLPYKKAMKTIIHEIEKRGFGYGKINYRLRDAVFSRQRYWGEPFPVYYKNGLPQMIDKAHLPIVLPEVEKYLPTDDGKPPLGNATTWAWDTVKNEIVSTSLIDNISIFPLELNTMPGWAGSSQYFNRYMDPENNEEMFSGEAMNYWQDVDLYIGGSEHATGHLLYSRFWQKFMFDRGFVPTDEYAKKLINQGMITGTSAIINLVKLKTIGNNPIAGDSIDSLTSILVNNHVLNDIPNEGSINLLPQKLRIEVEKILKSEEHTPEFIGDTVFEYLIIPQRIDVSKVKNDLVRVDDIKDVRMYVEISKSNYFDGENFLLKGDFDEFKVDREVEKMSKSKYNVVNPDQICEEYGADSLRLFEMFLGPLEQSKPWKTSGISGVSSFLKKMWRLYIVDGEFKVSDEEPSKEEFKTLHKTIKKVEEDIANFSFNTSVSTFMIAVNELTALKCNKRAILEPLAVIIEPYAPHIAEELWKNLGHTTSISTADFPEFKPEYLVESSKQYPVSFNGKMRFTIELSLDLSVEEIEKIIMAHEKTQEQLQGRTPKKIIIVPGKIINLVG